MASVLIIVGSLMISVIFLWSGVIWKLWHIHDETERLRSKNWPIPKLFIIASLLLDTFGGISIVINIFYPMPFMVVIALVLSGYTMLTAIVFHDYWQFSGIKRVEELASFLKNVAIAGALLLVAAGMGGIG